VVIDNFDLVGMAVLPFETNPELLVNPDAVLIFPVTTKAFQMICRRDCRLTDFLNFVNRDITFYLPGGTDPFYSFPTATGQT